MIQTNRNYIITTLLGALIGLCVSAHAGMIVEYGRPNAVIAAPVVPAPAAITAPDSVLPTIVIVGVAPAKIQRVKESVENIKLLEALRLLVPKTWKAFARDDSVKLARLVSFAGHGRPWPQVIEETIAQTGVRATIDWTKSEITFSDASK